MKSDFGVMFMDYQLIITSMISAGLGALVAGIFQLINKIIDCEKEKKRMVKQEKKDFNQKKEQAYINALRKLLFIRKGFDITREMMVKNKDLYEQVNEESKTFVTTDPTIKLYASDAIYRQFYKLNSYKIYAYTNSWRLFEDAKAAFDIKVNILSRLMQRDLGYRKYDEEPDNIKCPNCGKEHDAFVTCHCGLTYEQLQSKLDETLKKAQEQMQNQE